MRWPTSSSSYLWLFEGLIPTYTVNLAHYPSFEHSFCNQLIRGHFSVWYAHLQDGLSSGGWSWGGIICRIQISGASFLYLKMILGVEKGEQISGKSLYFLYPWDSCSQIVNIHCVVNLQIFTGHLCVSWRASQVVPVVKNPLANAGDVREVGLIPGLGRCPGEGNGNPLQYPCLENPMDRAAWWATVHGVTKTGTWPKRLSTHTRSVSWRRHICIAYDRNEHLCRLKILTPNVVI